MEDAGWDMWRNKDPQYFKRLSGRIAGKFGRGANLWTSALEGCWTNPPISIPLRGSIQQQCPLSSSSTTWMHIKLRGLQSEVVEWRAVEDLSGWRPGQSRFPGEITFELKSDVSLWHRHAPMISAAAPALVLMFFNFLVCLFWYHRSLSEYPILVVCARSHSQWKLSSVE